MSREEKGRKGEVSPLLSPALLCRSPVCGTSLPVSAAALKAELSGRSGSWAKPPAGKHTSSVYSLPFKHRTRLSVSFYFCEYKRLMYL